MKYTKEDVDSLLSLIRHNKAWEVLDEIDVEAYEQAEEMIKYLYSIVVAAKGLAEAVEWVDEITKREEGDIEIIREEATAAATLERALITFKEAAQ